MRVLLYGGTFDPPHNGHLNNLRAAASRVKPDLVVVMPAGVPPHKAASATPAALRLEMCRCFCALEGSPDIPKLTVSDWEIGQAAAGRRNYTVLTLEMLARTYPEARLYLAVGSDMLESFQAWHRWQDILQLARLVVVSREIGDDCELHSAARALDPSGSRILLAQVEALPMASREIRRRLAEGESCEEALPAQVQQVIRREGLYTAPGHEPIPHPCQHGEVCIQSRKEVCPMDLKQAKELARKRLGDKRYHHTLNVEKMAVKLAKRYGADCDQAALAALLHDMAKEMPTADQLALLRKYPDLAGDTENRPTPIWHGVCAAILAKTEWGVTDEAVLSAVACHTAGKPGMTLLDKILFLADMTSEERDFDGVEQLRKLEMEDIDKAMFQALDDSVSFVKKGNKPLDSMSAAARDYFAQLLKEKN